MVAGRRNSRSVCSQVVYTRCNNKNPQSTRAFSQIYISPAYVRTLRTSHNMQNYIAAAAYTVHHIFTDRESKVANKKMQDGPFVH